MPEMKLFYFRSRGRAEAIRLLLVASCTEFSEMNGSIHQLEEANMLPFGCLPVLQYGQLTLSQPGPIIRYLARLFDVEGETIKQKAYCDMVSAALLEGMENFMGSCFDNTASDERCLVFVKEELPRLLRYCITFFDATKGPYLFGSSQPTCVQWSYADIQLFDLVDQAVDRLGTSVVDVFPEVVSHRAHVAALPALSEYLQQRDTS
eukprot:TRINITY_DN16874_c0_g1_i1.p1 TRINITY_DN16874_c0_g1~~TRINITY_DN16874_c0_g1_i1.p1  ORF type:complete len:206 (+),score=36.02 TRINITY_DN16874_c0_g1_i1:58-675(+)